MNEKRINIAKQTARLSHSLPSIRLAPSDLLVPSPSKITLSCSIATKPPARHDFQSKKTKKTRFRNCLTRERHDLFFSETRFFPRNSSKTRKKHEIKKIPKGNTVLREPLTKRFRIPPLGSIDSQTHLDPAVRRFTLSSILNSIIDLHPPCPLDRRLLAPGLMAWDGTSCP
jgi:hypothetical protein